MKTVYVNFVGAPGVGKSLMSALTYAELKSKHMSAEMVQEYAKKLVYMEDYEMLNNQWMVSFEQYKMLKALQGKVKFVCCDSPLVVGLFYNEYHQANVCDRAQTKRMILSKMRELEPSLHILLERNEEYPFEKHGRIHTKDECVLIGKQIKQLLDEHDIEYLQVKSDKQNMNKIIQYIFLKCEK